MDSKCRSHVNNLRLSNLSLIQDDASVETIKQENSTHGSISPIEAILTHKDSNLLFMTMSVSMTSQNEMPIVRAYTDSIPSDIRGIHRITSQQHHHITPHFTLITL